MNEEITLIGKLRLSAARRDLLNIVNAEHTLEGQRQSLISVQLSVLLDTLHIAMVQSRSHELSKGDDAEGISSSAFADSSLGEYTMGSGGANVLSSASSTGSKGDRVDVEREDTLESERLKSLAGVIIQRLSDICTSDRFPHRNHALVYYAVSSINK